MRISFSPIRSDDDFSLERQGDTLLVNGFPLDFSDVAPGSSRSMTEWPASALSADPERGADGVLSIQLLLPHGPNAPSERLYPEPIFVAFDGPIALPGS